LLPRLKSGVENQQAAGVILGRVEDRVRAELNLAEGRDDDFDLLVAVQVGQGLDARAEPRAVLG